MDGDRSEHDTPDTHSEGDEQRSVDILEHDGLVGAQYYAWYRGEDGFAAQGFGGTHSDGWLSQTPGEPALGAYDSQDPDVIDQHMRWSLEHGINWWIITVGGRNTATYEAITEGILEADLAEHMSFTMLTGFVPSQQNERSKYDVGDPDIRTSLRTFMSHWKDDFATDPNYLHFDGRPTLYFWDSEAYVGDVSGVFEEVFDEVGVDPYVIGGPKYYAQPAAMDTKHELYDAILDYHGIYPDREYMENYREYIIDRHRRWRVAADHFDVEFIPSVTPGYNTSARTTEIGGGHFSTFLDRDPDAFRKECKTLNGFGTRNAVVVTSFNEWPEHSVIEPSVTEGNTFLQIVGEELTTQGDVPSGVTDYTTITITFDKTVMPNSQDSRELAFLCRNIELSADDGTVDLNVGSSTESYIALSGVYSNESDSVSTYRWLGGTTAKTELLVPASGVTTLGLTGRAIQDTIQATVDVDGNTLGSVPLGASDQTYTIP
ncbi:glycoside hydrolase family 99-like domain-containing protein [Halovivax cerinus]|uniref:Glycoside hydrolase family 99-like domain-containing protein n=1 Tax=Halovivax cerinus TaxID=1487865 RepID=A0ABD5NND1_9EURY|nr:glycoside hydrolase family 99-like domain-containing protein [Halovivax cerinus]